MSEILKDEGEKLLNAQVLYREWGRHFTILQQYLKGIDYLEKSIKYGNENLLWTLLELSKVLKKSGEFKKAAEIAEKCMNIDPEHLSACWTRMEALFDTAEFSLSLVYAHRGFRRRQRFGHAVLLANSVIHECVGGNASSTILSQLLPWIAKLREHRENLLKRLNDEEDEFQGLDETEEGEEPQHQQQHQHQHQQQPQRGRQAKARLQKHLERLDGLMGLLYLGLCARDKRFLQELWKRRVWSSANKSSSARLASEARDCLSRVQSQQEAVRARRPLYALLARARALRSSPGRARELWRELELRRCLARNQALYLLGQLHAARIRRRYPFFFQMVERVREKLEELRKRRLLGNGEAYLNALYRMVARVYLDPRNLRRFPGEPEKKRREAYLRRMLGLPVAASQEEEEAAAELPRDSARLGWPICLNVRAALEQCRERLALATAPLEILWIFHELARLFLQLRRYDLARFYSKKVRELGRAWGYEEWSVNGSHILLRIELAQRNRSEAKEAASAALESARSLRLDFLEDFYERALDYAADAATTAPTEPEPGSGEEGLASRLQLMLALASAPGRGRPRARLERLFRAMHGLPAARRLPLVPGCKPRDSRPARSRSGEKRSVLAALGRPAAAPDQGLGLLH